MAPKDLLLIMVERWSKVWREVVASTIAAILAWIIAQQIFGHTHPIFASVIAIVCLAPDIPNYSKQAWSVVLGVATGILVGEIALMMLRIPVGHVRQSVGKHGQILLSRLGRSLVI